MKRFIMVVLAMAVALAFTAPTFAAYNGAKNYESRPAASKASPKSTSNYASKSKSSKSKSAGKSSGFKQYKK